MEGTNVRLVETDHVGLLIDGVKELCFSCASVSQEQSVLLLLSALHLWKSKLSITSFGSQVYMCGTMALCSLYFVVTGVQMWATIFLTQFVGASLVRTTIMFTACAATGPIMYVVATGGSLLAALGACGWC
jgi:hypothetical protein